MVAVDPAWAGVQRQREEKKLGLKGSSTLTLDFDSVVVPRDHILGEVSKGMDHAHKALTWGRTFKAAGCLGAAHAAIAQVRDHVAQRVQFGRALVKFPLVRQQIAAAIADVYATESVVRMVCDLYELKAGDIGLDSAVAKILASEVSWDVVDRCLQLMGGTGYMEDAGMARRLRDTRVTRIFEGANDVLRLHLASATLGWSSAGLKDIGSLAAIKAQQINESAATYHELVRELGSRLVEIRSKWGFKLYERQGLQERMADAMIPLYAMAAVLLRASGATDSQELATAQLSCQRLRDRARRALDGLGAGQQPVDAALIDGVLG